MKAKERFRRWGESRGAVGWPLIAVLAPYWPEWAREAFRVGWMLGRIAYIERTARR